jgi:ATP-dependent Zn protease
MLRKIEMVKTLGGYAVSSEDTARTIDAEIQELLEAAHDRTR